MNHAFAALILLLLAALEVGQIIGTCEDEQLVSRIIEGDAQAEEELFRRYRRGVSMIVGKITGRAPLVQDLCQETFIIALKKLREGKLRDPDKLSAFMMGVARKVSLAYLRLPKNREHAAVENEELRDEGPDQYDNLLKQETAALVRQVLNSLRSARDRELLYKFYILEQDREQICSDLAITKSQFNLILHRAKKQYEKLYRRMLARGRPR